jgi:hypothetical protein
MLAKPKLEQLAMNLAMTARNFTSPIDPEVASKIRDFAVRSFREFAVEKVTSEIGVDHDNEQVINLVVEYDLLDYPVDLKSLIPLERNLRDHIRLAGLDLFVHVRHLFDEKQKFVKV